LKLVQERAGHRQAIGIGKDFISKTLMTQQLRERINKWHYTKLNSFCTAEDMVSKLKGVPKEWENIFAIYTSDKVLITRLCRELKKLN
jgi:hypothetical protein